ncbi:MAG: Dam family site-specific DNA-(adenine-N6)-methyltransferase [Vicinamibacterales bacterium]
MSASEQARPFLKWAGGKRQLLPVLRTYYPDTIRAYHEPFLGSGAVFFDLWSSGRLRGRRAWLSDENPDLVGCYLRVRDATEAVIGELAALADGHARGGADYYYDVRDRRFNPARAAWLGSGAAPETYPVDLAAALLYLNRTGYNGLFRLNRQGGYNVPAGRYLRPRIVVAERLRAAAAALAAPGVTIACSAFGRAAARARSGDFAYFDPPYAPMGPTANFRHYTARGFSDEDQADLQALAVRLAGRGVQVLLSNSSAETIVRLYGGPTAQAAGLRVTRVPARRAINTKAAGRGHVDELLVSNRAPVPA